MGDTASRHTEVYIFKTFLKDQRMLLNAWKIQLLSANLVWLPIAASFLPANSLVHRAAPFISYMPD